MNLRAIMSADVVIFGGGRFYLLLLPAETNQSGRRGGSLADGWPPGKCRGVDMTVVLLPINDKFRIASYLSYIVAKKAVKKAPSFGLFSFLFGCVLA